MKSLMVLLAAVMGALMMSAPVALAATPIHCTQAPDAEPECYGTNGNDVMYGYDNDNNMYGLYGDDYIFGFGGPTTCTAEATTTGYTAEPATRDCWTVGWEMTTY